MMRADRPLIRYETPADRASIHRVNEAAFARSNEADLVDRLREAADPFLSLVAEADGQIVGHILFTPVTVEPGAAGCKALGLAPMAVLPAYQNQGAGALLVREGLAECKRMGYGIVVVLGHPEYYPRFGFRPASQYGLTCEYPVPDEVFRVAELIPGALANCQGLVEYHPEFAAI